MPFSVSDGVQAVAAVGDIILIQQPENHQNVLSRRPESHWCNPEEVESSTIAFETTRLGPAVSGLVVNRDLQPQQVMSSSLQHLFSHLNWQQPAINVRDRQLPEKPSVPNAATMTSSASNDRFFHLMRDTGPQDIVHSNVYVHTQMVGRPTRLSRGYDEATKLETVLTTKMETVVSDDRTLTLKFRQGQKYLKSIPLGPAAIAQ